MCPVSTNNQQRCERRREKGVGWAVRGEVGERREQVGRGCQHAAAACHPATTMPCCCHVNEMKLAAACCCPLPTQQLVCAACLQGAQHAAMSLSHCLLSSMSGKGLSLSSCRHVMGHACKGCPSACRAINARLKRTKGKIERITRTDAHFHVHQPQNWGERPVSFCRPACPSACHVQRKQCHHATDPCLRKIGMVCKECLSVSSHAAHAHHQFNRPMPMSCPLSRHHITTTCHVACAAHATKAGSDPIWGRIDRLGMGGVVGGGGAECAALKGEGKCA